MTECEAVCTLPLMKIYKISFLHLRKKSTEVIIKFSLLKFVPILTCNLKFKINSVWSITYDKLILEVLGQRAKTKIV